MQLALVATLYLLAGAVFSRRIETYMKKRMNEVQWYISVFLWLPILIYVLAGAIKRIKLAVGRGRK